MADWKKKTRNLIFFLISKTFTKTNWYSVTEKILDTERKSYYIKKMIVNIVFSKNGSIILLLGPDLWFINIKFSFLSLSLKCNNNSSTNNNSAIELLACVAWTIIYFSFNFLYMNCISLVNWSIPWANYGFISNVALLFLYKGRKCTNTCSHRTYLSICWFLSVISNYTIKTSSFK